MYLISVYFDEKTEYTMNSLIKKIANATGNTFVTDGRIPPHITLLAMELQDEESAVKMLEENLGRIKCDTLYFASLGVIKGQVIYVEPVLNEYLHNMSCIMYDIYKKVPGIKFNPYYKPFGWIPHVSVGKHLNQIQMEEALKVLLKQFSPYEGTVTRIGIAKTNPHRDIKVFDISDKSR